MAVDNRARAVSNAQVEPAASTSTVATRTRTRSQSRSQTGTAAIIRPVHWPIYNLMISAAGSSKPAPPKEEPQSEEKTDEKPDCEQQ